MHKPSLRNMHLPLLQLVEWLHSCGATWDASAFTAAAQAGNGELLLWMAQRGAPMPVGAHASGTYYCFVQAHTGTGRRTLIALLLSTPERGAGSGHSSLPTYLPVFRSYLAKKILTAHSFGAFGSGNSDNRTFSRISGQILGENPLENPDSVRILPFLTGSQNGSKIMIILKTGTLLPTRHAPSNCCITGACCPQAMRNSVTRAAPAMCVCPECGAFAPAQLDTP